MDCEYYQHSYHKVLLVKMHEIEKHFFGLNVYSDKTDTRKTLVRMILRIAPQKVPFTPTPNNRQIFCF